MRLGATVAALFAAMLATAGSTAAQTYSASPFRQIIAKATVPDRNNEQLYISVVAGAIWANETDKLASSDGIYYQFTGTVDLALDGKTTTLNPGEGIFIQAGAKFTLKTVDQNRSSTYLQFLLSPTPGSDIAQTTDGTSAEIYRSPSPVPGLTHERNLLSLTRVPVPPQSPADPMHRRTGASIHYILSGVGAEFADGRAVARGPGSVTFEPAGYAYQWSNPGLTPLVYLLFNVSPKDIDPVFVLDQRPADPFSGDPHRVWALYCVAISMILALVVSSSTIADYYEELKAGARRGKKWWKK